MKVLALMSFKISSDLNLFFCYLDFLKGNYLVPHPYLLTRCLKLVPPQMACWETVAVFNTPHRYAIQCFRIETQVPIPWDWVTVLTDGSKPAMGAGSRDLYFNTLRDGCR